MEYIFLLSIFLIKFPPFYFLPIKNPIFTTHGFFIFLLIMFFLYILINIKEENKPFFNKEKLLLLLFLIVQSTSLVCANNISIFLQRYYKILVGYLIFITAKYFVKKSGKKRNLVQRVMRVIFIASASVLIVQLTTFFFPKIFSSIGRILIYNNLFDIVLANYNVGKLYDNTYLEIIIPILTLGFIRAKKNYQKVIFFSLILIYGFLSFVSNFRYRFLAFIFSIFFSSLVFFKPKKLLSSIFLLIFSIILVFTISNFVLIKSNNNTVIDRIFLKDEEKDLGTIKWRFKMFGNSISIANRNALGIGLGNFYDNLSIKDKDLNNVFGVKKQIALGALTSGPHNIFFQFLAETGYFGLLTFIVLLIFFLKKDFFYLSKKNQNEKKALIIMFWTLIFIVQFFPAINLTFYSMFFLLRALI